MPARAVVLEQATATIVEDADTLEGIGPGVITSVSTNVDEVDPDTLASDAVLGSGQVLATLDLAGDDDTISASSSLTSNNVEATLAVTLDGDSIDAAGEIGFFHATLALTEANDTLAAANQLTTHGAFTQVEGSDVLTSLNQVLGTAPVVNATFAITDAADTLVADTLGQNFVNGVSIGALGSGPLANFKLIAGDDFDFPIEWWNVNTAPTWNRYSNFHFNGGRQDPTPGSVSVNILAMDIDPFWRGPRSAMPQGTGVDPTSVASSVLTITMKKPDDATLIANLPTTFDPAIGNTGGKPALQTAHLRTGSYFQYSGKGDWCIEAVFEVAAGASIGYWVGPWETGVGSWPDFGEYDVGETTTNITTGVKTYDTGLHISDVDGGPDVGTAPLTQVVIPSGRPIWVRAIKTATQIQQYDDVASQGTLALRNTYSNAARVARIRGGHHMRFDGGCDLSWYGGTFNPAQWPKTVKYSWWRVWGPSSGRDWVPPVDLGVITALPGGSWSYVVPSPVTLYGATPDYEEMVYHSDGYDCPGIAGRNINIQYSPGTSPPVNFRTLGGMTYTPATRTYSGTMPTTEGGRIGLQFVGSFNTGGAARMAYKWFEVAPAAQASLLSGLTLTPGTPVSATVEQADFHSGNLGPHTYVASFLSGGEGLTIGYGAGASTVTITGTPTTTNDAVLRIVATNLKDQSNHIDKTLTNSAVVTIGGIQIGAAGSGTLSGFKLVWGDDFDTAPTIYDNFNRTGRYMMNPTNGSRCNQPSSSTGSVMTTPDDSYYVDEYWRGHRHQSPTPLAAAAGTVLHSGSVASVKVMAMDASLLPYMPTNYTGGGGDVNHQPHAISGTLECAPQFWPGVDGKWCIEVFSKMPAGTWANGFWYSFWTATRTYPDMGEVDVMETYSTSMQTGSNLHISTVDGGAITHTTFVALHAVPTNRYCQYRVIKNGNTITAYDDTAVAGTLAQVGTYTDARVGRLRGAHILRAMELLVNCTIKVPPQTWTAGQWPKQVDTDWWRYWGPSAGDDYEPPNVLADIDVAPGGSWAFTFPSAVSCYGHAVDREQNYNVFDNDDTPGRMAYVPNSFVPAGMTYNPATRTCSGTVPTTEGGRVALALLGTMSIGGPARVCLQYWNVAPAVEPTMFASQGLVNGAAMTTITLAYADFHSGNLGPHTYTVTKTSGNSTGLTVTMGSGNHSATITGTPTVAGAIVYDIVCENVIGQTTTVSRTLTVQNAVIAMTMNFTTRVYVYGATTYTTWADALASGHWTFARNLKAYRLQSTGIVDEMPANTIRDGLAGFRCEPARTQWARQSSESNINNGPSYATGITSAINNQTAPNGTTTADTLTTTTAASQHYIGQNSGIPLAIGGTGYNYNAGVVCEWSIFLKKGTQRYIQIQPPSGVMPSGLPYMNCDFDTGTTSIGGTGIITSMFKACTNGWYLCGITFAPEVTIDNGAMQWCFIQDMSATRNPTWTPASATTVYAWEMQHAVGDKITMPINNPNNNANGGVTRPADDLGIVLPAGTWDLTVTFMDDTTQVFSGVSGTYHLPAANLDQILIKTIVMS